MRRTPAWIIGLLAAVWVSPAAGQTAAGPVHTGKSRFAIPFRTDAAQLQRLGATEVRLFVSVDSGANWHHVQSLAATAARFSVEAPRDGSYWFAVRTVDSNGRLHPDEKLMPELHVVVDTQSPLLTLKLTGLNDTQVQLAWNASDKHLDANSLLLEYRTRDDAAWNRLAVTSTAAGKTSWDVPQGGVVEARGRVADFAGNAAFATDSTTLAGRKNNVPRPSVPDLDSDPIANVMRAAPQGSQIPSQFPGTADHSREQDGPDLNGFHEAKQAQPKTRSVSARRTARSGEFGPAIVPHDSTPSNAGRQGAASPEWKPESVAPVRRKPTIPTRVVRHKRFQLNYSVDAIGRSGVEAVELYITVNNGGRWYRYGADPDSRSPFPVVVPNDGTYGFTIRVRSGAGISDPPPQPGEKPAIQVVVDQTPPKLEMLPILQGRGSDAEKFLIRWKVSDDRLAEKPVSIAYAESPEGTWKTISGWCDARGSYLWKTTGDVPARVYIRLTARDSAGNEATVQTQRPIIVDVVKPSARITNVDAGSTEDRREN